MVCPMRNFTVDDVTKFAVPFAESFCVGLLLALYRAYVRNHVR